MQMLLKIMWFALNKQHIGWINISSCDDFVHSLTGQLDIYHFVSIYMCPQLIFKSLTTIQIECKDVMYTHFQGLALFQYVKHKQLS